MNSQKVHVSNIPFSYSKSDIEKLIQDILKKNVLVEIFLPMYKDSTNNKGFCNIRFETPELAKEFIDISNTTGIEIDSRNLRCNYFKESSNFKRFYKIKITNLNLDLSREDIEEFLKGGEENTTGFKILTMPLEDGKNKGFCIVSLPDEAQVRKVIFDIDMTEYSGKMINVFRLDRRPSRS